MSSPHLDGLLETLRTVAERIQRHQGSRIGEENTKVSLILPVLRALGWDAEDLDEVRMEFRRKSADKPVDFALMLQREPALFVEAKGLGESLDDRRWSNQVISYAAVAGVEWVVLTNGDEYRLYNAHAPVPVDDKLFRRVRISEHLDDSRDALMLLSKDEVRKKSLGELWRSHSIDNRVRRAVEGLFEPEADQWLVRRIARDLDGLTAGDIRAALARARISLDFPAEPAREGEASRLPAGEQELPGPAEPTTKRRGEAPARYDVTVRDLIQTGLIAPGTTLSKRYLGQVVRAQVENDGRIRLGDDVYESLSVAAGMARVAVKGAPQDGRRFYQTNGWTFWEYVDAAGVRREMASLRRAFLERRGD